MIENTACGVCGVQSVVVLLLFTELDRSLSLSSLSPSTNHNNEALEKKLAGCWLCIDIVVWLVWLSSS